jgi:hypothetical protein
MSSESLVDLMEKYKNNYYQRESKNTFFKKSQKVDCAKKMSEQFDLKDMIANTVYNIPNTNKIMFNYNIFKLYANENNYQNVVNSVLELYDEVLKNYDKYEVHVILESFTISAAERYKDVIKLFCNTCMSSKTNNYSEKLSKMYIYYTPSMIESISTLLKPFVDPNVFNCIVYYSKAESSQLLQQLVS